MHVAPREEFFAPGQHGVDELVEHILGRLAEERGVGKQCLVALAIQARNMTNQVLPACVGFNHWYTNSLGGDR